MVDERRLGGLLCPYRGGVTRTTLTEAATIWLSSLAGVGRTNVLIPEGTRKNASTAWVEITVEPTGLAFEPDPLGTFPLWWFSDDARVVITSEVKSLSALRGTRVELDDGALQHTRRPADFSPFRGVRRVYPGAILRVSPDLEVVEERRTPLLFEPNSTFANRSDGIDALDAALVASARACSGVGAGPARYGTFLSGGIDSSLATAVIHAYRPDVQTFTLGTELGNEYADAAEVATHFGLAHHRVAADEQDALSHFDRAVFCNEVVDGLTAEIIAQLGVLAAGAATQVQRVVTGYGADLLFGSMLGHAEYMAATGVDDLRSLIERTCWTGEFAPFYAWSLGVEIHHLFWDPTVMNTAFRIPAEFNRAGDDHKALLRDMAAERGHLARGLVRRRKQAMTDGTQFNRLLSTALGIEGGYAYHEKSAHCVARLKHVLDRTETKGMAS